MEDSIKTVAVGVTGAAITGLGVLPDVMSVLVGLVTIVYLGIKIYKELHA
tara:strand:+ start:543 stop:692 length:150 start_codon:yes stop_codon:yes gene_type:complete